MPNGQRRSLDPHTALEKTKHAPRLDDKDERIQIRERQIKRHKIEEPNPRRAHDRHVPQEPPRNHGSPCVPQIPHREERERDETHDEHRDDRSALPFAAHGRAERQREQDERHARPEERQPDKVKLVGEVPEARPERAQAHVERLGFCGGEDGDDGGGWSGGGGCGGGNVDEA